MAWDEPWAKPIGAIPISANPGTGYPRPIRLTATPLGPSLRPTVADRRPGAPRVDPGAARDHSRNRARPAGGRRLRRPERLDLAFVPRFGFRIGADERRKVLDAIEHRSDLDQSIVHTRTMGTNAGPRPIVRARDEAGPDRIQADMTSGGDQMCLIHRHGSIAPVEEVACPTGPGVDESGVTAMAFADSSAKSRFVARREDQMYMVGHQAAGPHHDARLPGLLGKHVTIDVVVAVLKEYGLTPVAPRRDVVGDLRDDDTSETGHGDCVAQC